MPTQGQVFDLIVSTKIGPWREGRRHPGVVVSRSMAGGRDSPWVVVPMSGTKPPVERPSHVQLNVKISDLDPPLWVQCEYPTTLSNDEFYGLTMRGAVPHEVLAQVRHKLSWVLGII